MGILGYFSRNISVCLANLFNVLLLAMTNCCSASCITSPLALRAAILLACCILSHVIKHTGMIGMIYLRLGNGQGLKCEDPCMKPNELMRVAMLSPN